MRMQIFKYFTLKVFKHREKLRNFTVNTYIPRTTFYINIYYTLFIIYPSIIYNSASFYLLYFIIRILVVVSHHFNYLPSLLNTPWYNPFSLSYFKSYINPKYTLFTSLKMIYPPIYDIMLKPNAGILLT